MRLNVGLTATSIKVAALTSPIRRFSTRLILLNCRLLVSTPAAISLQLSLPQDLTIHVKVIMTDDIITDQSLDGRVTSIYLSSDLHLKLSPHLLYMLLKLPPSTSQN